MRSAFSSLVPLVLLALPLGCASETPPAEPPPAGAEGTWLLTGGIVVTMDADGTVLDPGAVAINGSRIEAVGSVEEIEARFPGAPTRSAEGRIVLPGLINTHTHVPMTLFRGLADDLPLMEWLQEVIFPAEAANVDEEFVRWGTRLACLELLRGGTTTFVDMYYFEDAIAEEAEACGMRAIVGQTLIDFPAPDNKSWADAVAYMESFLERWQDHERITPAVAPHAPYTVSAEHLQEAHELATRFDVPMLIHLAEDSSEVDQILARSGKRPVAYADDLGILDDRVLAAHMVWPSPEEIATLAERGVGVAHCPQSNMKVAAGIAPVPALLAGGVDVGVGTDGPASNNDLDLWEEIDTAAKIHKVTSGDPTVVSAEEALRMATIGGARAIGLGDEIGSLEPGKRADLIVVDPGGFHQQPLYDPFSTLVYSTKAADVRTVLVEGELLLDEGEVLSVDADSVRAKVAEYRERLKAGLGR
jgi:5-methylthioadenosine/S-adenosylhomocysteine deaminase